LDEEVKTRRALLIVPAALLSATLSVAVPGWDIELTGLEEHAQTQRVRPLYSPDSETSETAPPAAAV
jgi:hypothetical protein